MDDPIISRDTIRAKARAAFARGVGRDNHGMNWHASAMTVWQEEWDLCEQEAEARIVRQLEAA